MPTVPRYDAPTVAAQSTAQPYRELGRDFAADAFGAGVGRAQQTEGVALASLGDVISKHVIEFQKEMNQTEAKDNLLAAEIDLGKLETQFRSLQGSAAMGGYDTFVAEAQKIREKYLGSISNMHARRLFDHDFTRRLGYSITDGAKYTGGQARVYQNEVNKGTIELAVRDGADDPFNDNRFLDNMRRAISAGETESVGKPPEMVEVIKRDILSSGWASRIGAAMELDHERAKKMFEDAVAARQINERDRNQLTNLFARNESARINRNSLEFERMGKLLEADLTSRETHGRGNPDVDYDKIRLTMGVRVAEDWKYKAAILDGTYKAGIGLSTMTGPEIAKRLEDIAPKAGSPDARKDKEIFEATRKTVDDIFKSRISDPATSVWDAPTVQAAMRTYDPAKPGTFVPVAAARMASQREAGVSDPEPITKDEATTYKRAIQLALPGTEVATFREVVKEMTAKYGPYREKAIGAMLGWGRFKDTITDPSRSIINKIAVEEGWISEDGTARTADQRAEWNAARAAAATLAPPSADLPSGGAKKGDREGIPEGIPPSGPRRRLEDRLWTPDPDAPPPKKRTPSERILETYK